MNFALNIFSILLFSISLNWLISLHFAMQIQSQTKKIRRQMISICLAIGVLVGVLIKYTI